MKLINIIGHFLMFTTFFLAILHSIHTSDQLEDSNIDSNNNIYHNTRHRHNTKYRHHKRLYGQRKRNRRVRVKTTYSPFNSNYDESHDYDYHNNKNERINSINLTAKVGDSIILNCAINSSYGQNPGVIWMQGKMGNVLTLNTNRITADGRFEIIQTPLMGNKNKITQVKPLHYNYIKRRTSKAENEKKKFDLNFYHLKINNVQSYDENEYTCETTISQQATDRPNIQSLIYLKVTQSPSFIESLTSHNDIAANENSDISLDCHAIGKPKPSIKWFKITEGGSTIDLKYRRNRLVVKNVSRKDLSKYECVADNGIQPSVSKKFSLNINYEPVVIPIRTKMHQNIGEQILIGCKVKSNPDSTVKWYKIRKNHNKNQSMKEFSFENNKNDEENIYNNRYQNYKQYEEIDFNIHQRYQKLIFKQTNQTVTYLKIQTIEESDYTYFKCEATNALGTGESVIQIQDLQAYKEARKKDGLRNNLQNLPQYNLDFNNGVLSYYDLYDEDYITDDEQEYQMMSSFRDHKNRTYYKYSKNKSDRLVKNDDSLQRINGLGMNNRANTMQYQSQNSIIQSTTVIFINLFFLFTLY